MNEQCKENCKEFLETLHEADDEDMMATECLKEFVYRVIKAFAKENSEAYLQSNLIELMNHVVEKRRQEIFAPEAKEKESNMSSSRTRTMRS